jgi:hypothetical protein
MMTMTPIPLRDIRRAMSALMILLAAALGAGGAGAQEDNNSAPPPLQLPALAGPNADGQLPFTLGSMAGLRFQIEQAGNLALCEHLMKNAGIPVPTDPNFSFDQCPDNIKSQVNGNQGQVAWADGARPTQCARNCIGPPFNDQTLQLTSPNFRFGNVYGHLDFAVDVPGPFNRTVTYFFEIHVRCDMAPGQKSGVVKVDTKVEAPVVDDPGILEQITDLTLLPLGISNRITAGIQAQLSSVGGSTQTLDKTCRSIGAAPQDPSQWPFDAFVWDTPKPGRVTVVSNALTRSTVTVHFDRIIRHQTLISDNTADPFTFRVYLNGMSGPMPRTGEIVLPVNGTSNQAFCKTIDVSGADALQILFTSSTGGAAWSQFPANAGYGAGGEHSMTTGLSVVVPGNGPGQKPHPIEVREFELQYHIEYHPPASVVAAGPGISLAGATPGAAGASAAGGRTTAAGKSVVAGGIARSAGIKEVTVFTPCTTI